MALLVVLLLATSCTSRSEPVASSSSVRAGPSAPNDESCRGLGLGSAEGQVTWVANNQLVDETGCLLRLQRSGPIFGWGGKADRVVVGDVVAVEGGRPLPPLPGGNLSLSRPTGTSLLQVNKEGELWKRNLETKENQKISFMAEHEAVAYHPAGHHIVSSGRTSNGEPALVIADNQGRDPRPLLEIEEAKEVANPTFTASGALLYTADHGNRVDLHRLEIGSDKFSTIVSVKKPSKIGDVTASPFPDGGVAWTTGDCASRQRPSLIAEQGGAFLELKGTEAEHARPVGWLPDGSLVAISGQICDRATTGKLLVVRGQAVEVIANRVTTAAVRAVLPPPPPPPQNIPQQAPA
ncbi:MAG TPA: hypothetical protein VM142_05005 [Acidimicrobiales bacterium]|nr:hypothetical protein [Acidimicrobiales bacterium]